MLQWRAIGYGATTAFVVAAVGWFVLGFVDGVLVVGSSGLVGGLVTGVSTDAIDEAWRAGGYYGMLAAGFVGILLVATAAVIAVTDASVVSGSDPGPARTAASVIASPLAIPLFTLEGIAGGIAGGWIQSTTDDDR